MGIVPTRCYGATFLILFPGKNLDQANYLLSRFQKEFEQASFYGEKRLGAEKLSLSISAAEYPGGSEMTFDEFFARLEEK
jgi:GGDEF domain-containing protein